MTTTAPRRDSAGGTPQEFITIEELWIITAFGFVGLVSSILIWIIKVNLKFKSNEAKLSLKKFVVKERTKRMQVAAQAGGGELDLSDLEEFR